MHSSLAPLLQFLILLQLPIHVFSAFTFSVSANNDTIDQNSLGTWCFYPSSNKTGLDVDCTGAKGDFRAVMAVHLAQGVSISYYSASIDRLGGSEYPVQSTTGKVYLCYSGQATDKSYKTACELSTRDNQFGGNKTICAIPIGQSSVTDGCYAVGQNATSSTASSSQSRQSFVIDRSLTALFSMFMVGLITDFFVWS